MRFSDIVFPLSLAFATVSAGVVDQRVAATLQNERGGLQLNERFQGPTVSSKCMTSETACINGQPVQCVGDEFVIDSQGTSFTCDTSQDIKATRAEGGKREIENRQYISGFIPWTRAVAATATPTYEAKAKRVDASADIAPTPDTTKPSLPGRSI
ncbi:hypothetical protein V8E53_012625 [Lactarius tabidus]